MLKYNIEDDMFLQNFGLSRNYTALKSNEIYSSTNNSF
jgi:hypothetical protein